MIDKITVGRAIEILKNIPPDYEIKFVGNNDYSIEYITIDTTRKKQLIIEFI